MEHGHSETSGLPHIMLTAGVAVVALLGVGIWQVAAAVHERTASSNFQAPAVVAQNASTSASTAAAADPIANVSNEAVSAVIGTYNTLQTEGIYSTSTALEAGGSIAASLQTPISYPTFAAAEIKTDPDTSYARMMQYRSDLKATLEPLTKSTEPEYAIFASYVQTGDASYLAQLQQVADNYRGAASSTAALIVPSDAVTVQVGILNAMEEFGATIQAMANHAQDPIASAVLLENYNQAESGMYSAFNALIAYEKSKQQ